MKSSFQTIILVVFIFVFVIAVAVFSGIFSSGKSQSATPQGSVLIWGVLPYEQIAEFINNFNAEGVGYSLVYVEHRPETFAADLTTALADGVPPDAVIVSSDLFSQFKDKLSVIPYTSYSERAYRDTNVDGAQIFLSKDGVLGIPLLVDPLVVYYNKDMLAAANYALPPASWDDLIHSVPLFTKRDGRGAITQSTVALGETQNVEHFKDILAALFLQSGNAIIAPDKDTGAFHAALTEGAASSTTDLPTAAAAMFYASFADPTSSLYSWNRSLTSSRTAFVAERTAFYIGRASELFSIQSQNPNLNFDVTELFQPQGAVRPITFGSFIGLSILKSAPNVTAAYALASLLSTTPTAVDDLSKRFSLPPARRDLLLVTPQNPYVAVFFKAALSSFTWPDPNPSVTDGIFRAMIGTITSGKGDADTAINEANQALQSNIR